MLLELFVEQAGDGLRLAAEFWQFLERHRFYQGQRGISSSLSCKGFITTVCRSKVHSGPERPGLCPLIEEHVPQSLVNPCGDAPGERDPVLWRYGDVAFGDTDLPQDIRDVFPGVRRHAAPPDMNCAPANPNQRACMRRRHEPQPYCKKSKPDQAGYDDYGHAVPRARADQSK